MNVLKIVIVSFIFIKLFAVDLYVPKDYNISLKHTDLLKIKRYKNLNEVDFNKSLVLISSDEIPLIYRKKLVIIIPIGERKEYIITKNKPLSEIKKIINLDFPSKILLDNTDKNYKSFYGTLEDFLKNKADAIVMTKKIEKNGFINFPLQKFGIDFNKYFIVSSRNFIEKRRFLIKKLNRIFEKDFDFRKDLIYQTLFISALYLHKKIDFNKELFENYFIINNDINYLNVDVTPNWPPFDIYKDGKLFGIGVDFWNLIAKKANLKYKFQIKNYWDEVLFDIKNKKSDLTINTSATSDRKKFAIFSKPYISFPLAIICRSDENLNSIKEIKSIAVGKNFTAETLMKKHYPYLNYIETDNVFDALKLVENKKAQCAVDILPVILWTINKNHLMNLQIAFKTPFKFDVQIMVRKDKPELLEKINKAINEITPQEKNEIINKYLNTIIIEKSYIEYWILIVIGLIFILGLIIYIKNKNKVEKMEKLAECDVLTKLQNRRGVYNKLKNIKKGSILFFDIDHFKKINDTYGHDFGDYVLSEIGKILKNNFRKSDILGRWGGEEFIVILPNVDIDTAIKLAEKLRGIIENYNFKGKRVTVSIGVSEYNGNFDESFKKADEALYNAKNNGRNQVKGKR